jgi:rhamnulose-1-phosphate aldolase/alcohol dehydrogenase
MGTQRMASDIIQELVRRSNRLGADPAVTNTGGGNTSAKATEHEPASGTAVEVLWVKGSGGDLRTATARHFAALDLSKLERVREAYQSDPGRGLKMPAENAVVEEYRHCAVAVGGSVAPSIDTPLHAFLPARHIDHTHPNAVIAIAATRRSRELTRRAFGGDVGWLPWMRPGMELGLALRAHVREHPQHVGVVLAQHGLINWAEDSANCYDRTLALIQRASRFIESHDKGPDTFGGAAHEPLPDSDRDELLCDLLPWLRGRVGGGSRRVIATVESGPRMLRFVNSHDALRLAALGTSCPDHFLRTKIKPLLVQWDPQRNDVAELCERLDQQLGTYRDDYARYYEQHRTSDSPPMRDPNPAIILIPGVGMIAWGRNKSESRIAAECYNAAVEVMRGAEAIDEYVALPPAEAFDIEYWALEEAKLRRLPPEGGLAGQVVVIVGSDHVKLDELVGAAVLEQGGHVVYVTPNHDLARDIADALMTRFGGASLGVGGTGISSSGRVVGIAANGLDPSGQARQDVVLAYGGADAVILVRARDTGYTRNPARLADLWKHVGVGRAREITAASDVAQVVANLVEECPKSMSGKSG